MAASPSPTPQPGSARQQWWQLLREVFQRFNASDPFTTSAAISYYALFSLPAILVVVVSIAGSVFRQEAVSGVIFQQFRTMLGDDGARQLQAMVASASLQAHGVLPTLIGLGTILFSATALFVQLQKAINKIWGLEPAPGRAVLSFVLSRLFSFGMITVVAFLLLVSLVISAVLSALSAWLASVFSVASVYLMVAAEALAELLINTLMFGVLFKVLPDARVGWKTVRSGAFVTALLFMLGHWLIGFYLGRSNPASTYGAASSVVLLLLWVSYSSLIVQFGAVFTQVYSQRFGRGIRPKPYAVPVVTIQLKEGEAEAKRQP